MKKPKNQNFLAHVRLDKSSNQWVEHDLVEHSKGVASMASKFAMIFGAATWARLAGFWHDMGKFSNDFQTYIKQASGYNPEAHLESEDSSPVRMEKGRVNHSSAGALHANSICPMGRILSYLIAGHHAGLPDWYPEETGMSCLSHRLKDNKLLDNALHPVDDEIRASLELDAKLPRETPPPCTSPALWIRMLFSCLVDADYLDTELFMDYIKNQYRSVYSTIDQLLLTFNEYMERRFGQVKDSSEINAIRADVLQQCIDNSSIKPGLFSLTVPTGGGKTLSAIAFALNHAMKYKKERIIYVIPYTSIIEQTAEVLRSIFGKDVIEHHSNFESDRETDKSRLACENWDAPIIVTTNVQFFESLFAARTSRARKLHNVVNSVVILDEAQLLSVPFLKPTLKAIQDLASGYKTTFVMSTATQPAFKPHEGRGWKFDGLKGVREIIRDPTSLSTQLNRVNFILPKDVHRSTTWELLAKELRAFSTVLCIVNTRLDCKELFQLMPEGTVHLSAQMCGAHRSEVIKEIKERLERKQPIRVISTQLVEAGVDLDFPVVFRALAGLDSIAQAAGRCNREGKLSAQGKKGLVVVFPPPKEAPAGILRQGQDIARTFLSRKNAELMTPESFEEYFRMLYWTQGDNLDREGIWNDLERDATRGEFAFRTAARKFRLIEDNHLPISVSYGDGKTLLEQLQTEKATRHELRKLQRFTVTIPRRQHDQLLQEGLLRELSLNPGIFVPAEQSMYHPIIGFDAIYRRPNPEDYYY